MLPSLWKWCSQCSFSYLIENLTPYIMAIWKKWLCFFRSLWIDKHKKVVISFFCFGFFYSRIRWCVRFRKYLNVSMGFGLFMGPQGALNHFCFMLNAWVRYCHPWFEDRKNSALFVFFNFSKGALNHYALCSKCG